MLIIDNHCIVYANQFDMITILINGFQTGNEKSRRSSSPIARNAHVQAQRTKANTELCAELQALGGALRPIWTSKSGKLTRFVALRRGAPFPFARVTLVRLAPVPLVDASESLPSALSAVRDGVADALGVDDAELLPAWGADGEPARKPGAIEWAYEQRRGGERGAADEWGVRIVIEP